MKLSQLRPCWGVAFSVGLPAPRNGAFFKDGVKGSHRAMFSRAAVQKKLRRVPLIPFTDGHEGRRIGYVLWTAIRSNSVVVYGVCERAFLDGAVLSFGGLANEVEQVNGVTVIALHRAEHVAVYTKQLGAFDTFLKRWQA